MKRQRFYCFRCFAQSTDIHLSGKTAKLSRLANNGKSTTCTMDNFVLLVVPGLSSIPAAARLQHRDQRISENCFQKFETSIRSSDDSKWQTCMPETDADQFLTSRWTGRQFFQTSCTRRIQRKAFPIGYSPSHLISRTLETCARTLLWKSELRFGKWDFKSGDTKMEAQCSFSPPQIPKEIYSTNRRVWWLDNSRAQKRISEQSPGRCLGTRSHYSVDTTRVKPKLHRRRRRILWKFSEPSQKPKVIFMYDLWEFGKWRIITESSPNCSETRNCRNELYVE